MFEKKYNNLLDFKNTFFHKIHKMILYRSHQVLLFHYAFDAVLLVIVTFSIFQIVQATTPNPGHPWNQVGDGTFAITGIGATSRTFTIQDANATILTTTSTISDKQIVVTTSASNNVTGITIPAGYSIRRNIGDTAFESFIPSTGDVLGPAANTDGYIPLWNGTNSKTLKEGLAVPAGGLAGITALGNYLLLAGGTMTGGITNSTSINPLTTLAESWIGPSSTTGFYFKSGNVGIGTTTPGSKLEVNGSIISSIGALDLRAEYLSGNDANIHFKQGGYHDWYIKTPAGDNPMNFIADTTTIMSLKANGNVGIGTTSPTQKLTINQGNIFLTPGYELQWGVSGVTKIYGNSGSGGYLRIEVNGSEVVGINNLGNIGIGTTAPTSFKLQVAGNVGPNATDTYDLGSVSNHWNNIYANNFVGAIGGAITPTGFTAGPVVFGGTAGVLAQDSANFFWDDTNNRLGIGTTTPADNLTVYSAAGINSYIRVSSPDGYISGIKFGEDQASVQSWGGQLVYDGSTDLIKLNRVRSSVVSNILTADNLGNVGIGTTAPMAFGSNYPGLTVGNTAGLMGSGTIGNYLTDNLYFDNTNWKYKIANYGTYISQYAGDINFFTAPSGTVGATATATSKMTILNGGNVGIGTTAPAASLHVVGSGSVIARFNDTATNGGVISYLRSGTAILDIGTGLGLLGVGTNNDAAIYSTSHMYLFADGGTSTLTLTGGKVGIGTTAPGAKLDVSNNTGAYQTGFYSYSAEDTSTDSGAVSGSSIRIKNYGDVAGYDILGNAQIASRSATTVTRDYTGRDSSVLRVINGGSGTAGNAFNFLSTLGGNTLNSLMVLNSGGNVGIGTTNPSSKLSFGSTLNQTIAVYENASSANLYGIGMRGSNRTGVFSNGIEGISIDYLGNVGIGTTAPGTKLDVAGAIRTNNQLISTIATGTSPLAVTSSTVVTNLNADLLDGLHASSFATSSNISGTQNYVSKFNAAGTGVVNSQVFDNGTNVGIGTTTPGAKFDVRGDFAQLGNFQRTTTTTGGVYVEVQNNARSIWGVESSTGGFLTNGSSQYATILGSIDSYPIQLATGNNVRMTVDGAGNVGVGTTNPQTKLSVSNGGSQNIEINPSFIQSFNRTTPGYAALPFYGSNFSFNVGNVGIGTTAPNAKLEVNGGDIYIWNNAGNPRFLIGDSSVGGNYGGFRWDSTNDIVQIGTDTGGYTLNLNENGNVGIGTTTPGYLLTVSGGGSGNDLAMFQNTSASGYSDNVFKDNTGVSKMGIGYANASAYAGMASTNYIQNVGADFQILGGAGGTTANVMFKSTGNVGIGTTAPTALLTVGQASVLSVAANIVATFKAPVGQTSSVIRLEYPGSGGNHLDLMHDNSNASMSFNGGLAIQPNGVDQVRITSVGNVGIGTTGPNYKLDVNGAIRVQSTNALSFYGTGAADTQADISYDGTQMVQDSVTKFLWKTYSGGWQDRMVILNNGNVGIGTIAPGQKLEVAGNLVVNGASYPKNIYIGGNAAGWEVLQATSGTLLSLNPGGNFPSVTIGGNVGIGTTSPGQRLTLADASSVLQEFKVGTTTFGYIGSADQTFAGAAATDFAIYGNIHPVKIGGRASADLTVDTTGNVGIGTTGPGFKLDVAGTNPIVNIAPTTGTQYAAFRLINTGNTSAFGIEKIVRVEEFSLAQVPMLRF